MKYLVLSMFALSACSTMSAESGTTAAAPLPLQAKSVGIKLPPVQATEVRDQAALERLRGNSGLTLQ